MNTINFRRRDSTRNDDLKPLRPVLTNEQFVRLRGCHTLMAAQIMSDPYRLSLTDPKIKSRNGKVPAFLQLSKPLMGDLKAPRRRHRENALRMIALMSQAPNAVLKNVVHVSLRREVDKDDHSRLDASSDWALSNEQA